MKNKYILEACVDSVESAIAAEQGGANRLELCSNLIIGGTTPSPQLFNLIREKCSIDINVLIRPRAGDFCYTGYEFEIMKREVEAFRALGAHGVVIGVLKPEGSLDKQRLKELIEAAGGMSITLSRAFDMTREPFEALEDAKDLGVATILTSGQKNSCYEGRAVLKKLKGLAEGKVEILIGGGVTPNNIASLYDYTGILSYHLSGKKIIPGDMRYFNRQVAMGSEGCDEYSLVRTDKEIIMKAKKVLEEITFHKGEVLCY